MDSLQSHMRRRGLGPKNDAKPDWTEEGDDEQPVLGFLQSAAASLGPLPLLLDDILVGVGFASCLIAFWWRAWSTAFCALILTFFLVRRVMAPRRPKAHVTVVCISDTHGGHRDLSLPAADILIHAGDFTKFGKRADAEDFNAWLGELPFRHKIVVNGNHENNAEWQPEAEQILSNAVFLKNRSTKIEGLQIYGTDFCWPMKQESPLYSQIPHRTDIVVVHGPARGFVDGRMGCRALLWAMGEIRPRLVVSGHIHDAHGLRAARGALRGTTFVNAANCRGGYNIGWAPMVVEL